MEPPAADLAWLSTDICNIIMDFTPPTVRVHLILASRKSFRVFSGNKEFWCRLLIDGGFYIRDNISSHSFSAADVRRELTRCNVSLRNLNPGSARGLSNMPMEKVYGIASWLDRSSSSQYSIHVQFTSKQSGFRAVLRAEHGAGSYTNRRDLEQIFVDSLPASEGHQPRVVHYDTTRVRQHSYASAMGPGLFRLYDTMFKSNVDPFTVGVFRLGRSGGASIPIDLPPAVADCFPPRLSKASHVSRHVVEPQDIDSKPVYVAVSEVKIDGKMECCISAFDLNSSKVLLSNVLLDIPDIPASTTAAARDRLNFTPTQLYFYQSSSTLILRYHLPGNSRFLLYDLRGCPSADSRLLPTHSARFKLATEAAKIFVQCGHLVCCGQSGFRIFPLDDIAFSFSKHLSGVEAVPTWEVSRSACNVVGASMCGRLLAIPSGWGQNPLRIFDILERRMLASLPGCHIACFIDSNNLLAVAHGSVFRVSLCGEKTELGSATEAVDNQYLQVGVFSNSAAIGPGEAKSKSCKQALVKIRPCHFESDVCQLLGIENFDVAVLDRLQIQYAAGCDLVALSFDVSDLGCFVLSQGGISATLCSRGSRCQRAVI